MFYFAKEAVNNPVFKEAVKNAAVNGAISGSMSIAAGDDKEGIIANTAFGAVAGAGTILFKGGAND